MHVTRVAVSFSLECTWQLVVKHRYIPIEHSCQSLITDWQWVCVQRSGLIEQHCVCPHEESDHQMICAVCASPGKGHIVTTSGRLIWKSTMYVLRWCIWHFYFISTLFKPNYTYIMKKWQHISVSKGLTGCHSCKLAGMSTCMNWFTAFDWMKFRLCNPQYIVSFSPRMTMNVSLESAQVSSHFYH